MDMKDNQINGRFVFCENIVRLRKKNGLSCKVMAKRLGVSEKTIRALESGVLPPRLSCAILFRIEREFGVSPKEMFQPADGA